MPKQARRGPSKLEELYSLIEKEGQDSVYEPDTYMPPYIIREYIDDEGTIQHVYDRIYKILHLKRKFLPAQRPVAPSPPQPSVGEGLPPEKGEQREEVRREELSPPELSPPSEKGEEGPIPPVEEKEVEERGSKALEEEGPLPEEESSPEEERGEEKPSHGSPPQEKEVVDFSVNPLKEYEMFKSSPQSGEGESGEEKEEKPLKPLPAMETGGDEDMDVVIPYIDKHKPVELGCPYYLNLSVEEEAEKLLRRAQAEVESEGKADKDEIRKRIYELTKELLTSKDAKEKEEIRKQIKELKGMLSVISKGGKPTTLSFLEEIILPELSKRLEEFLQEVKAYKESIENSYNQAKNVAKGDEELEKRVEETYRQDMEELKKQALGCGKRLKEHLLQLYLSVIDQAEGKEEKKKELKEKVEEKLKLFEGQLARIFGMAIKEKEEKAQKEKEEKGPTAFVEYEKAIKEVESLKETELLHFLHSHDRRAFMDYIRGVLDKEKALLYAKRLYAIKVKNVPEHIVNKYYEEVEV